MPVANSLPHSMPDDLKQALAGQSGLLKLWEDLTPLSRNEFVCWVISAKQEATRAKRIVRTCEELLEGKRRPCCWPGCPHRRSSAAKWFSRRKTESKD